jgi:predicted MPP superfamily phosphohydrolase
MPDSPSTTSASFRCSLWDLFCTATLVGIWPRFIEPNLIFTTRLNLKIPDLPPSLVGFKILQISDLHLNPNITDAFLERITRSIQTLHPDLIVFTGDFLCYSLFLEPERLARFFNSLHAPYGCFAILGNHDYAQFVSVNTQGQYDVITPFSSPLTRAFKRLLEKIKLTKTMTDRVKNISLNSNLVNLLNSTPFQLLHNTTVTVPVKDTKLNICGLGEYLLGKTNPSEAFANYDTKYPGLILLHNPDGAPLLKGYPGHVVLCGHTHGGQVNLPWMWQKFTLLENMQFKKGLIDVDGKQVYINRGIGSVLQFRWFAPPEILLLTLLNQEIT